MEFSSSVPYSLNTINARNLVFSEFFGFFKLHLFWDGHKEVSPVENDGAISASKVIDTLTLLAQQLQGQGSESVEIVQPASSVVQLAQATVQPVQPTVQQKSDQISAITEQQFYQQLETCFFMLAPDKQEVLRRDIMKYAFRRTNQLMDDNNWSQGEL